MSKETLEKVYLNPITFEAYRFLKALKHCSRYDKVLDEELLNVMDNLVEVIQEFLNQCKTKIDETDNLTLIKSYELKHIQCKFICECCHKQFGNSFLKIKQHITEGCPRIKTTLPLENQKFKNENQNSKNEAKFRGPREVVLTNLTEAPKETGRAIDQVKDSMKDHIGTVKSINRNWYPDINAFKSLIANQNLCQEPSKSLDTIWDSLKEHGFSMEAARSINPNRTQEMGALKGLINEQEFCKESVNTLDLINDHDFHSQATKTAGQSQHPDEAITMDFIKDLYVDSKFNENICNILQEDKWMKRAYNSILNKSIEKFFTNNGKNYADLERSSVDQRTDEDLRRILKPLFPNERIKFHRTSPLMCPFREKNRGIDIFVDIGNRSIVFENSPSPWTLRAIKDIKCALNGANWTKVKVVENVPIPYIKAKHFSTHILYNISVSNSLAFRNAKLINYFFKLQPIVHRLNNYLEKWLRVTQLTSTIRPYCMTLLIIYYFQLNNLLPSVEKLQVNLQNRELVGPWIANFMELSLNDCGIKKMIECTPYIMQQYLAELFEFLGKFDYENYIICPYFGTIIKKSQILSKLPTHYLSYVQNRGSNFRLKYKTSCVVVDPIQLNYNISANKLDFQRFKDLCRKSVKFVKLENPDDVKLISLSPNESLDDSD